MNEEEFKREYDGVLNELGFVYGRGREKGYNAGENYKVLIYIDKGLGIPMQIVFYFYQGNELGKIRFMYDTGKYASKGIWDIKIKDFSNMEDLIFYLKEHKKDGEYKF